MAPSTTRYVAFLANPIDRKAERKLLSFRTDADDFRVHGREIHWLCRIRSSESEFSLAHAEKELGIRPTFRTSNTVREIAVKYGAVVGEKLGLDVIAGTTGQSESVIPSQSDTRIFLSDVSAMSLP